MQENGTAISSLVTDFIEEHKTSEASEIERKAVSGIALAVSLGIPFPLNKY